MKLTTTIELATGKDLETMKPDKVISFESGGIEAFLEMIVRDRNGNITDYRRKRSDSFVANFLRLLFVKAASPYTPNVVVITDISGAPRNVYNYNQSLPFKADGGAGSTSHGIVVGTNAVAPTINDISLGALIAHGVGGGQLQYSAMTFGAPADDGTVSQFRLTRDFANGSGGAIIVQEVGLYVMAINGSFMTIRDITGGIAIPNGQTLTLNYQIQGSVPGFVRQFIQLLYMLHTVTGYSVLDITNTSRVLSAPSDSFQYSTLLLASLGGNAGLLLRSDRPSGAAIADGARLGDILGIQVGTGSTAPASTNYAMGTRIAHGQAEGQLVYAGSEIEPVVVSAPSATMLLRRFFYNKSGGAITVNEVGLYTTAFITTVAYIFLACRDVIAEGVPVDINELLRVQYAIGVTV